MKFRVELAWKDGEAEDAPSIYLAADGSVILQGRILGPRNARSSNCRPTAV
jgi:hypothetical protein